VSDSKLSNSLDLERLATRARHGSLSDDELHRFEEGLAAHPSLRLAYRIGRDFDQELRVRAGDDALVLRASGRVLSLPGRRRAKARALLLGVAAALLLGSAAAASLVWSAWDDDPQSVAPANPVKAAVAKSPAAVTPPAHTPEGRPGAASAQNTPSGSGTTRRGPGASSGVSAARPPVTRRSDTTPSALSAPAPEPETAAELFAMASAARRAGDLGRARELFASLQWKFPQSSEARVSRVSLGKLLLAENRPADAEREFAAYLAGNERALEEEAYVGRATALARIGRDAEEVRVWQDLLRRHPSSLYATKARERLQALGAAAAMP
jgi:TolA-binding protein